MCPLISWNEATSVCHLTLCWIWWTLRRPCYSVLLDGHLQEMWRNAIRKKKLKNWRLKITRVHGIYKEVYLCPVDLSLIWQPLKQVATKKLKVYVCFGSPIKWKSRFPLNSLEESTTTIYGSINVIVWIKKNVYNHSTTEADKW